MSIMPTGTEAVDDVAARLHPDAGTGFSFSERRQIAGYIVDHLTLADAREVLVSEYEDDLIERPEWAYDHLNSLAEASGAGSVAALVRQILAHPAIGQTAGAA